jgi:hypothetical protein
VPTQAGEIAEAHDAQNRHDCRAKFQARRA